jgi:hypothetical protein
VTAVTDEILVKIDAPLTSDEWRCIREFKRRAAELAENSFLKQGFPLKVEFVSSKPGEPFTCTVGPQPPEEALRSLLLTFRLFWANDEPSNFLRILNIIGRHSSEPKLRQYLELLRSAWNEPLFHSVMTLTLGARAITANLVFDLWLNAHYFHSDPDKQQELERLSQALAPEFMKFLLVNAVTNCARVVLMLEESLRDLEPPHAAS